MKDGVASRVASDRKVDKYPGCTIYPFAIEAHGRFGESSCTLIKMLAPRGDAANRTRSIGNVYQAVASSVQRSNADAILAAAR